MLYKKSVCVQWSDLKRQLDAEMSAWVHTGDRLVPIAFEVSACSAQAWSRDAIQGVNIVSYSMSVPAGAASSARPGILRVAAAAAADRVRRIG